MNREDIIQPIGKLLISQTVEPNITFHPGDPAKEVMRIDKNGVKVNPEYSVDEATQHVLNALTAHIQHTVNHAVAAEREACAKLCEEQRDLREEARAALRVSGAFKEGDEDTMLRAMRHESNVRLYHAGIDKCATAIRARGQA